MKQTLLLCSLLLLTTAVLSDENKMKNTVYVIHSDTLAIKRRLAESEIKGYILRNNDFNLPRLKRPNWTKLSGLITKKYKIDGERTVTIVKMSWFKKSRPNGNKLAEATIRWLRNYMPVTKMNSIITLVGANNALYSDVAIPATNKKLLLQASEIQWEIITKWKAIKNIERPNEIDTYACLLYKGGKKTDALKWIQLAIDGCPKDIELEKELKKRKVEMQEGKPLSFK